MNRSGFLNIANYEMKKLKRKKDCLIVILIDLDDFKCVNDQYGHNFGDQVLVGISQLLINAVREQDSIGRWGGEEIMILLPNTSLDKAKMIAERIRSSISELQFIYENKVIRITATIGLAEATSDVAFKDLLQRADQCLYYGKTTGKNKVVSII